MKRPNFYFLQTSCEILSIFEQSSRPWFFVTKTRLQQDAWLQTSRTKNQVAQLSPSCVSFNNTKQWAYSLKVNNCPNDFYCNSVASTCSREQKEAWLVESFIALMPSSTIIYSCFKYYYPLEGGLAWFPYSCICRFCRVKLAPCSANTTHTTVKYLWFPCCLLLLLP